MAHPFKRHFGNDKNYSISKRQDKVKWKADCRGIPAAWVSLK